MQFASHATNQDLVSETRDLCDADSTSYPIEKVTRRINIGLEKLVGEAVTADGSWDFDDTNFTDQPISRGTLVEAQSYYSFTTEYLKVLHVDVLNTDGRTYKRLKQITRDDLGGLTPEEYFGTNSGGTYPNNIATGSPQYYDILGDSIVLYPAPTSTSVTLTNGLRVTFKRTVDLFTTTDTTQEPGIPSPFHYLLAVYAALWYCMLYKKDRVPALKLEWEDGVKKLIKFYSKRNPDRRPIMTNKIEPYF